MEQEYKPSQNTIENLSAPRIKIIDDCDFPIIEREIKGYKVLVLPASLQRFFDEEGYHAVRINSVEVGNKFPIYGGKTTASRSLLPHQDHIPTDPRRFLTLSKNSSEKRGSVTYMANPLTVRRALPELIKFLEDHRDALKKEFVRDPNAKLSEEELLSCFEPNGLDALVEKKLGPNNDPSLSLFIYTGILTYLIQGESVDALVEKFLEDKKTEITCEKWETNGTLIIDNSKVFHGRLGGNINPLQRNWLVSEK